MPQMNMKFIGSLVLFFALKTIVAQNVCSDRNANCINIRNCPEIISILRGQRPLSAETLQALRSLQCGSDGTDPKVCCRQQQAIPTTPTTEAPESENVPDPPDVSNHPNLRLLDYRLCGSTTQPKITGSESTTEPKIIGSESTTQPEITGGNKTGIFQYPWMALIAYDTGKSTPEFRCAGTIISSRYILTAAHCVTSLPTGFRLIGARVGDHDVSTERDCERNNVGQEIVCAERYQDFGVDDFYFHPDYSRTKLQNDIALIRLNSTVDFGPLTVKPICLPFGTTAIINFKTAIVTGWNVTEFGPSSPDLLQARLPLKSNAECKETYKRNSQIWYKQICAGGDPKIYTCLSYTGGPLQAPGVINGNSVRMIQHGVVSYGMRNCFIAGFPEVYTRVAYYMDWILDTMTD